MSLSAAHSAAFRREVPREGRVWTIRDAAGHPAPTDATGRRAMPFWSKPSRAERVIGAVAAYRGFAVVEIPVHDWLDSWLPGLDQDDLEEVTDDDGAEENGGPQANDQVNEVPLTDPDATNGGTD